MNSISLMISMVYSVEMVVMVGLIWLCRDRNINLGSVLFVLLDMKIEIIVLFNEVRKVISVVVSSEKCSCGSMILFRICVQFVLRLCVVMVCFQLKWLIVGVSMMDMIGMVSIVCLIRILVSVLISLVLVSMKNSLMVSRIFGMIDGISIQLQIVCDYDLFSWFMLMQYRNFSGMVISVVSSFSFRLVCKVVIYVFELKKFLYQCSDRLCGGNFSRFELENDSGIMISVGSIRKVSISVVSIYRRICLIWVLGQVLSIIRF